ncbi:MAG: hypothetical protein V4857_10420 [Pseudomonadota bacterium]
MPISCATRRANGRSCFSDDDVRAFRTVYSGIVREGELLNPENCT